MKLKNEFITYDAGSESMLVPVGGAGFSGLVKGNKTLGTILALLKEETTEDAVIANMMQQYDVSQDVIATDVRKVLNELRKIGALDEQA